MWWALAGHTRELFPEVHEKITYVHNGLDPSQLVMTTPNTDRREPFVLTVCRQVEKKGTDTLVRAFALVLRDFPALRLVVIGDGSLLERNKALAHALHIDTQVRFMGDVARLDVLTVFAACTVFVLPSRAEPFGVVLLEAAYFRKAVVCTKVGGILEVLKENVSGLLVEPENAAEMAARIIELLRATRISPTASAHRVTRRS